MGTTTFPPAKVDETQHAGADHYSCTTIVHLGPYAVRAAVHRDANPDRCYATAEVLSNDLAWTPLVVDDADNWFDRTATPSKHVNVKAELGSITDELIQRVTMILPQTADVPAQALDVVGTLLAVAYGSTGELLMTPGDVLWAKENGGPFRFIALPDGNVLLTKAHRYDCPLLATQGVAPCDGQCQPPSAPDADEAGTAQ